jgi:hypothetical protein
LRRLAEGDDGYYELQRRRKLAPVIAQLHKERLERPRVLLEARPDRLAKYHAKLPLPRSARRRLGGEV